MTETTARPVQRPHVDLTDETLASVAATLRAVADDALDADGGLWAAAEYAARVAAKEQAVRAMLALTEGARNPADSARRLFDTEPCGRCGGTGRFSWCSAFQDRCFTCWGSGIAFTTAGSARHLEWVAAVREAREPSAESLVAGDVILTSTETGRPLSPGNKGTWRTVTRIEPTVTSCGSWLVGTAENPVSEGVTYYVVVWVEGFEDPFWLTSQTIRRRADLSLPTGKGMVGWVEPVEAPTARGMASKRAARTKAANRAAAGITSATPAQKREAAKARKVEAWNAANPDLAAKLTEVREAAEQATTLDYTWAASTLRDLAYSAGRGPLSDAQVALATRLVTEVAEEQAAREAAPEVRPAQYLGTKDEVLTVTGTVRTNLRVGEDSPYGARQLIVVETTDGDTVKMFTTARWAYAEASERGATVTITGTVKDHETYQDTPQTLLARVKLVG